MGTLFGSSVAGPNGAVTIKALSVPFPGTQLYVAVSGATPGKAVYVTTSASQAIPASDLGSGLLLNLGRGVEVRSQFDPVRQEVQSVGIGTEERRAGRIE